MPEKSCIIEKLEILEGFLSDFPILQLYRIYVFLPANTCPCVGMIKPIVQSIFKPSISNPAQDYCLSSALTRFYLIMPLQSIGTFYPYQSFQPASIAQSCPTFLKLGHFYPSIIQHQIFPLKFFVLCKN